MSASGHKPTILLIENDDNDVFLFRRALSRCHYLGDVRITGSAWEARNYLEGRERFTDRRYYPIPDLIVSDLHLPGASGIEFVRWLRSEPQFEKIPLILWSGSMPEGELKRVLEHSGITDYALKTANFALLCDKVEGMLNRLKKASGDTNSKSSAFQDSSTY
jgi:CheY-like chemotaxis protein